MARMTSADASTVARVGTFSRKTGSLIRCDLMKKECRLYSRQIFAQGFLFAPFANNQLGKTQSQRDGSQRCPRANETGSSH